MGDQPQLSLLDVLDLGEAESKDTATIRQMKEKLGSRPPEKGNKLSVTFKMDKDRHGKLLHALKPHEMTMTDLFTLWVDQIIPVLLRAKPVAVPSYRPDDRRHGRPLGSKNRPRPEQATQSR